MKRLCWLPLLLLASCALAPDPDAEFCLAQARAEPDWRIEDAAKWIVHATRGGEHALASGFAARKTLELEWASLAPPTPGEPLWTPLTPDGRIGRLHLRPFKSRGGSLDALHAAFLAGAESFEPNPARFRRTWRAFGRRLAAQPCGFLTRAEWKRLDRAWRAQGYPALHHSDAYRQAQHPAYRVLPLPLARPLLDALPAPPPAP